MNRRALLALAGLFLSCAPDPPPLEVEYSGCWAVYAPGPVCALWPQPHRRLNLWIGTGDRVEIRAGGRLLEVDPEERSGGWFYRVEIPEPADLLTVSDGTRAWSLRLAGPEKPAWLDEVAKEGSRKLLTRLLNTVPDSERGAVLKALSLLARADGHLEQEERYLKQWWDADRAVNRWSGEVDAAIRLAGLYIDLGRLSEAQQTLAALPPLPNAPGDKQSLIAYHRGLLADAVGDYRSALEQLRTAAELAERLGRDKYRWDSEQILARVLQDLGRTREAADLFTKLKADPQPSEPCDLGNLLSNWGWSRLLAREAGEEAEDPTPILEDARAEFDTKPCTPGQRLGARLNLALAHQQAGRWEAARRELEEARALSARPSLAELFWWDNLEARAAIAAGRPERALDIYEKLEKKAELALSPESRLQASLGLAQARIALGQRAAALEALAEADRRLDRLSWHIPAHEGRDTFLAQRDEATRLYLQLLLEDGQRQRALDLARRSRSRLLRQLAVRDRLAQLEPEEQREWTDLLSEYRELRDAMDLQAAREWEIAESEVERARQAQAAQLARTRDALDRALASLGDSWEGSSLSPPGPGEVLLTYHPLPDGRWAGFASTAAGKPDVSSFTLPEEASPETLSRILLRPFQSVITASERVRVLPYGKLRSVDFQTLPFAGEPLFARRLVVYSLDLAVRPDSAPPAGKPLALVVSNPQGNLPAAQEEAAMVAAAVRGWGSGWSTERLEGSDAQARAVLDALPGSRLFHYAGHGTFAGFAGWDSELPLADQSRLTLRDVLSLQHSAPQWVVLSSCDAGRSSEEAPGEGIGLANAFLLAGSRAVIAANQPVADRSTRDLMREIYRGWQPGADLPRQLQRAQLACRRQAPSSGAAWTSFRVLVP